MLIVGVAGWCRSWYAIEPASSDVGKVAFRVEFDCLQIARDARDSVRAVQHALERKETEKKAEEKKPAEAP